MFLKFKKKGLVIFLLGVIGVALLYNQYQSIYAIDIKDDGLKLIETFNQKNIEIERTILNYTGVVNSYKNASNVHSFAKALEQAFSVNLSLTSESERDLIKYQGQKNVPSLQHTKIQVSLAGVLHENNIYQAHLIISLLRNSAKEQAFVENFAYLNQLLESVSVKPEIKVNIQGSINKKLSHETQQEMIMNMFATLNASIYGGLNEKKIISLTGYSEELNYSLGSNEKRINVQIASRFDVVSKKTKFSIGTPLITTEY